MKCGVSVVSQRLRAAAADTLIVANGFSCREQIEQTLIDYLGLKKILWLDRGIEYPLLMGFLALQISIRGGGRFSLDRLLGREI